MAKFHEDKIAFHQAQYQAAFDDNKDKAAAHNNSHLRYDAYDALAGWFPTNKVFYYYNNFACTKEIFKKICENPLHYRKGKNEYAEYFNRVWRESASVKNEDIDKPLR